MKDFEKIIEELDTIGQEGVLLNGILLKRSDVERQKELLQQLVPYLAYVKANPKEISGLEIKRLFRIRLNLEGYISNLYTLKEEIEILSCIDPDSERHIQSVQETITSLEDSHENIERIIECHLSIEE